MKFLNKLTYTALAGFLGLAACDKVDDLPFFANGKAPAMTTSTTTVAALPTDADKTVFTVNWTNPEYSTDSTKVKYLVEIAPTGSSFAKPSTREVIRSLSTSYTGKELNDILLGFGFEFNKPYDVDVRVISSYANNNERYTSNVVKVKATPYKVPPKVPVTPTGKLFIIGSATSITNPDDGGWKNPVPAPVQEFARLDETTFGGVFNLEGGSEFLILPENGSWGRKFAIPSSGSGNASGGDFAFYDAGVNGGDNFIGPLAKGNYTIIFDFQTGKYTITPFTAPVITDSLYGIGDATAGSWDNSKNNAALRSQFLPRLNSAVFEGNLALFGGKNLKFISSVGDWQPQFGKGGNVGVLGANYGGGSDPDAIGIAENGNYKITVNFLTNSYSVVKLP